jgi:hypothetical protein
MENKENFKFADLKIMFPNWSHGTIHNRIKYLKDTGSIEISRVEPITKKVFYNKNAVNKLRELYLKDFPDTTKMEFFNFENVDQVDLNGHNESIDENATEVVEVEEKKEKMEGKIDQKEEKTVNSGHNESIKSIPVELHNKIVAGLEKQVDILSKEVERLSSQNNLLITQHESLIQNNETLTRVIGVKEQNTLEEKREKRQIIGTAEDNQQNLKWWEKIFGRK